VKFTSSGEKIKKYDPLFKSYTESDSNLFVHLSGGFGMEKGDGVSFLLKDQTDFSIVDRSSQKKIPLVSIEGKSPTLNVNNGHKTLGMMGKDFYYHSSIYGNSPTPLKVDISKLNLPVNNDKLSSILFDDYGAVSVKSDSGKDLSIMFGMPMSNYPSITENIPSYNLEFDKVGKSVKGLDFKCQDCSDKEKKIYADVIDRTVKLYGEDVLNSLLKQSNYKKIPITFNHEIFEGDQMLDASGGAYTIGDDVWGRTVNRLVGHKSGVNEIVIKGIENDDKEQLLFSTFHEIGHSLHHVLPGKLERKFNDELRKVTITHLRNFKDPEDVFVSGYERDFFLGQYEQIPSTYETLMGRKNSVGESVPELITSIHFPQSSRYPDKLTQAHIDRYRVIGKYYPYFQPAINKRVGKNLDYK